MDDVNALDFGLWDFQSLLDEATAGNRGAMSRLLYSQRKFLLKFVRKYLDPRLAARLDPEDVVQEIFLVAAEGIWEYLKTRPVAFRPWLEAIAQQHLSDTHRAQIQTAKRSVCREGGDSGAEGAKQDGAGIRRGPSPDPTPSSSARRDERNIKIEAVLKDLPPAEQEIFRLRFFQELSPKEIAERLGITVVAVRMRLSRAYPRIEKCLSKDLM